MKWQALTAGKAGEGWFAPSLARQGLYSTRGKVWKPTTGGSVDLQQR